jgi:hypothetical protein
VDKYSDMIAEEVKRYKAEILEYFHAREIESHDDHSLALTNANPRLYTTSIARTTYEIESSSKREPDLRETTNEQDIADPETLSGDRPQGQTFLTEEPASTDTVPFTQAFRIPSNLVQSIMFK